MNEFDVLKRQLDFSAIRIQERIQYYKQVLSELKRTTLMLLDNCFYEKDLIDRWLKNEEFGIDSDGFWQSLSSLKAYERNCLPAQALSYSCHPRIENNRQALLMMYIHRNMGFYLEEIKQNLPHALWIYYQDVTNMSFQYPYIHQASTITPDFDWSCYHTWQSVCPENNPDRGIRWTSPTIDYAGGGLIISVSIPVYREDSFLGLWSIDLPMESLFSEIFEIFRFHGQTNFISDIRGGIIYHPLIESRIDREKGSVFLGDLSEIDSSLGNLDLNGIPVGRTLLRETRFEKYKKTYLLYRRIAELDWILFSTLPESELLIRINGKIDDALRRVGKGNYAFRMKRSPRDDKYNIKLIESFNAMAEALQDQDEKIRETQQIIVQSEKMRTMGTLAGGIAHDFNNILTSILGYTELALGEEFLTGTMESYLRTIYSGGIRARDLIKQLMSFSRLEMDEPEELNLSQIIDRELVFLKAMIPTSIIISKRTESKAAVLCRSTHIHQILINLCVNASHAMPTGGELKIETKDVFREEGKDKKGKIKACPYVLLAVEDNGTGIHQDHLPRIFDPLFTTKPKGEGTGLGLSVVKEIVNSYEGRIEIKTAAGEGTRFTVYLPQYRPILSDPDLLEKKQEEADLRGDELIFIADDEEPIVRMLQEYLNRLGYVTRGFADGLEVLRMVQSGERKPDLIITDMTMPHLGGTALAKKLEGMGLGNLPLVLCTGNRFSDSEAQTRRTNIRRILLKPLNLEKLAREIRRILDGVNPEL